MKKQKLSNKKQQKKKIILASLAVGAAGILGYFGWQYFQQKRKKKMNAPDDAFQLPETSMPNAYAPSSSSGNRTATTTVSNPSNTTNTTSSFPLKKGSRGELVKALQQALINKYGSQVLPRYGADGDFGSETAAALEKLKLPSVLDQSTYNSIVQKQSFDQSATAQKIYDAIVKNDFNAALALLKTIGNRDAYRDTSNAILNYRINGVHQTLVNAMLNTFTKDEQKQAIRFEFTRMGLQYDGKQWSLSGFDGRPLITTVSTTVWSDAYNGVKVPARMVLGTEVSKRLDYTLFENNGKYFLVQTNTIKYLQS